MITLRMNKQYRAELPDGDSGTDTGTRGGDAIGSGNDARLAMMAAINDANDGAHAEDYADINDDGTTAPFVPEINGEGYDVLAREDTPPADDEDLPKKDEPKPEPQMITRKVNGKELTMSLEDWLVRASKVEAADEYLQDAAAAKRAALSAEPQQPRIEEPPKPDPQALAAQNRAERLRIVRAIQMGTEDEAEAAIAELQTLSARPTITMDDVSRVTDDRLRFNTAIKEFNTEYKDLVSDPVLHRMVLEKDAALISRGDARPYAERYAEVGNEVRAWKDGLIKANLPPPAPVADLDARRNLKAAAPKIPTAANVKAIPAKQETEEDDSPASVIASMAKARGGPQWARS